MTGRLAGQIAIVTGAAQGIGAAIARRFAREGAQLLLVDLTPMDAASFGDTASFVRADVAREDDMRAMADAALARFGGIDVLVHNAGIYPTALIEGMSVEHWNRVIGVNLTGAFLATQACVPAMRARRRGRIVLMSSITGPRVANPGVSAYAASKAGINGFIRSAALELAADGITVNGVEPGNILTEGVAAGRSPEFIERMRVAIPLGRLGAPEDVANAVLFLASDEAAYVTGTTLVVDGGQVLPENKDFADASAWE